MKAIILLLLVSTSVYSDYCKNSPKFVGDVEYEVTLEKFYQSLANRKVIAQKADQMLSKLISKKSPVVFSWMSRRKLDLDKPEYVARQWREYYFKNFILRSFSEQDEETRKLVDQEYRKIAPQVFTKKKTEAITKAFNMVKADAERYVNINVKDPQAKTQILDRVKKMKLFFPMNLLESKAQKYPLDMLDWGFAYDPVPNEINIGANALIYNDFINLYAMLAHEVGHGFDSCRYGAFFKGKNPFLPVQSCLRVNIGAKRRDDSDIDGLHKKGVFSKNVVLSLKENLTCNKSYYPLRGKQKDQLDEVFADWFSSELIAISELPLKGLRNDLCIPKGLSKGSSYISNSKRLYGIYLTHPIIAKKVSLKKKYRYCHYKSL